MVAFVASLLVTALMVLVIVRVGKRRPRGTPLTWGEAFVAAMFVFALFVMIYGIVPNSWLIWADNDLGWRSDRFGIPVGGLIHPFGLHDSKDIVLFGQHIVTNDTIFGGPHDLSLLPGGPDNWGKIQLHFQILRDIIATMLYLAAFGLNVWMWLWWQKRTPAEAKKPAEASSEPSAFGRPVLKQG